MTHSTQWDESSATDRLIIQALPYWVGCVFHESLQQYGNTFNRSPAALFIYQKQARKTFLTYIDIVCLNVVAVLRVFPGKGLNFTLLWSSIEGKKAKKQNKCMIQKLAAFWSTQMLEAMWHLPEGPGKASGRRTTRTPKLQHWDPPLHITGHFYHTPSCECW